MIEPMPAGKAVDASTALREVPTVKRSDHIWQFPRVHYRLYEVGHSSLPRPLVYQTKRKVDQCVRALMKGRQPPPPDGVTPRCFTPIGATARR